MKITFISIIIVLVGFNFYAQQLAFPTAEGYGKYTVGGRGSAVYEVTNLKDSGEGSLRAAVEASGARTVVFRVAGTIDADITISNDQITIAGKTSTETGTMHIILAVTDHGSPRLSRYQRVIVIIEQQAAAWHT